MSAGDYQTKVWYDDLGRRRTTMLNSSDSDAKLFDIMLMESQRRNAAQPTAAAPKPGSQYDWSKAIDEYGKSGFDTQLLPDEYDDAIIRKIATEQGSGLLGQLARQRAGGQLTGAGYDAAMRNYETQFGNALGSIGDLSSGVLAQGRQGFNDILGTARTDLDKMKDKSQFSLDPYKAKIGQSATDYKAGFEQSLMDAIGRTQYFSNAPSLTAAGAAQGKVNRPSNSLLNAVEQNRANASTRGLGNGGMF